MPGVGLAQGAVMSEIFERFCDAEFTADWDHTVARHGDAACYSLMPRSDTQRRFDALYAIFERAASVEPGAKSAIPLVNLSIDFHTVKAVPRRHLRPGRTGRSAAAALRNSGRDPGPARRCGGGDDLGTGASGGGRLGRGGDQHGTPPTTVQRQRERGGVVAVESVCDGWLCDTDPTLRSRPPHGMGPSRPHRRTQRCTSVRTSQPVEELRLPRPPRRPRVLAHLPTRRNRNQLTARAHCDTPSSGSGV